MCEWNPKENRARYNDEEDCPNPATWSVGTGKRNIHLCDDCAKLPIFKRLTSREPLKRMKVMYAPSLSGGFQKVWDHPSSDWSSRIIRISSSE